MAETDTVPQKRDPAGGFCHVLLMYADWWRSSRGARAKGRGIRTWRDPRALRHERALMPR